MPVVRKPKNWESPATELAIWSSVVTDDITGLSPAQMTEVEEFALSLGAMGPDELYDVCQRVIWGSAQANSLRFGRFPDHAMATLAYNESERRVGNSVGKRIVASTIYSRADAAIMAE